MPLACLLLPLPAAPALLAAADAELSYSPSLKSRLDGFRGRSLRRLLSLLLRRLDHVEPRGRTPRAGRRFCRAAGEYRTGGVVANMTDFREAFGCKAGQPMVREPVCRISWRPADEPGQVAEDSIDAAIGRYDGARGMSIEARFSSPC
jgi:hypothetical protein